MIDQLRITVLVENTAGRDDLVAEHGLALWIEADDRKILFDTGQGPALAPNAEALGINLEEAYAVALSHGHYDHTGGLAALRNRLRDARLYVHPAAFDRKFGVTTEGSRYIGASLGRLEQLQREIPNLIPTIEPTEIVPGVSVTGEIPRRNDFEDVGGPFFRDDAGRAPDSLPDDQAMYIDTRDGVVILLGCAHAGVVNTLDYVAELTGADRFHAVLGGMHLVRASEERISRSIAALRAYNVQLIGPCHCTGAEPTARIREAFPERFMQVSAGSVMSFPDSPR
jgi:7,8-dihydropterin-6-yl-methyl-4-(beta-D-ribofuranosyl)aminobenzene 5'-phosphate synthase